VKWHVRQQLAVGFPAFLVRTAVCCILHATSAHALISRRHKNCGKTEDNESRSVEIITSWLFKRYSRLLSTLPAEILLKIFGFINPREEETDEEDEEIDNGVPEWATSDYLSLVLTCRALKPATTTMLYQKYDHNWDYTTSTPFIERLITQPGLATLVKEVKETGSIMHFWNTEDVEPYNTAALRAYKPYVPRSIVWPFHERTYGCLFSAKIKTGFLSWSRPSSFS
jgi:hypothetical protein